MAERSVSRKQGGHRKRITRRVPSRQRPVADGGGGDARYRTLFDSSRDAIMVLDRHGFFDCNPATLRMFGCTSRRQFLGQHPSAFSPLRQPSGETSRAAARRRIAAAFATGSQEFEWVHRRLGGGVFPATVLLSRTELDGISVLLATVRDVTAYSRAESLLKLQRDLAVALTSPGTLQETLGRILTAGCRVEGIDCGGIYLVDAASGTINLVCHRGLSRAFVAKESAYTRESEQFRIVMQGGACFFSRKDILAVRLSSVMQEGVRSLAVVPVKHAEQVVAVLNLASHAMDEIVPRTRGVIAAIAAQIGPTIARVRAEAAVVARERNLNSLFNTLEDFLFIAGLDGRLLHVNPVVERRLGYTADELRGKPVGFVHPAALRQRAAAIIRDMLAGRTEACDIPLVSRSGTWIPVETKVVQGEWNGAPALFGISRDITERQRAERELLDRQQQLRSLVSQLTVAEETERRRIAHGLHDDIGQLLALCKLNLGHLATLVDSQEARSLVADTGEHLDHLLRESRALTFDLASPVLQRFGLVAAIEDLCEKLTERHGISFSLRRHPAGGLSLPNNTEILVFHAVRELLHNVVKHAGARHATVTLRWSRTQLVVTVEDDGVGFAAAGRGGSPVDSFGLHAIRERMGHLGGAFVKDAVRPHGARITLTLPLVEDWPEGGKPVTSGKRGRVPVKRPAR